MRVVMCVGSSIHADSTPLSAARRTGGPDPTLTPLSGTIYLGTVAEHRSMRAGDAAGDCGGRSRTLRRRMRLVTAAVLAALLPMHARDAAALLAGMVALASLALIWAAYPAPEGTW